VAASTLALSGMLATISDSVRCCFGLVSNMGGPVRLCHQRRNIC
jgi:hypothetical protein